MITEEEIREAEKKFGDLIRSENERLEIVKNDNQVKDYSKLSHIVVGILPGDGIGPLIMKQALRVVNELLKEEIASGRVELREIPGMTIENRVALMQSLPDSVLAEAKKCDALVKGPFVTPRPGDPYPNLVSANSLLRRALQLFAAVRPIDIPEKNVHMTFFRENIEGEYLWGNKGIQVNDDLGIDFKVLSTPGAERFARAVFNFAKNNGKKRVTVVTKSNIVKLADGNFLKTFQKIGAEEYPDIEVQNVLVDAFNAKMMDPEFNEGMSVIALPNLYGDIVTDAAAEQQGGLGTACSSNIGNQYALFEAIHGTAPYLISHGRADYADPCSLIRAMGEMMAHIGFPEKKEILTRALEICTVTERKVVLTTFTKDASTAEFTDYLLDTIKGLE